ncbi:MAG: hypothetical protein M3291_07145 [Actinomycetota bacterium]|nr:hypothetical protein [Actinomycetota bacterium]
MAESGGKQAQNDPPQKPTLEEQHEDERPDVSAEDVQEHVADQGHKDQGGNASGRPAGGSSDS